MKKNENDLIKKVAAYLDISKKESSYFFNNTLCDMCGFCISDFIVENEKSFIIFDYIDKENNRYTKEKIFSIEIKKDEKFIVEAEIMRFFKDIDSTLLLKNFYKDKYETEFQNDVSKITSEITYFRNVLGKTNQYLKEYIAEFS